MDPKNSNQKKHQNFIFNQKKTKNEIFNFIFYFIFHAVYIQPAGGYDRNAVMFRGHRERAGDKRKARFCRNSPVSSGRWNYVHFKN